MNTRVYIPLLFPDFRGIVLIGSSSLSVLYDEMARGSTTTGISSQNIILVYAPFSVLQSEAYSAVECEIRAWTSITVFSQFINIFYNYCNIKSHIYVLALGRFYGFWERKSEISVRFCCGADPLSTPYFPDFSVKNKVNRMPFPTVLKNWSP